MRLAAIAVPVLLLAAAAAPAAAAPVSLLHDPVTHALAGRPVRLALALEGEGAAGARARVHWRGASEREYRPVEMTREADGTFAATLPAAAAETGGLRYWVEAIGPGESYRLAVGGAQRPLAIHLRDVPTDASAVGARTWALVGLGLVALAAGTGFRMERRRRASRLSEQLFWLRTLRPLLALADAAAADEVRRLASTPLDHPRQGLTMYSRAAIWRRLQEMRTTDVAALVAEAERMGLARAEGPSAPAAATPSSPAEPARRVRSSSAGIAAPRRA